MRVVVDIPNDYYETLKKCRDDELLADSLLIKYGEPLFDVIYKLPSQEMTKNEMALMLASVDVDDVLDKIRAEIEAIIGEHRMEDYDFCSGLIAARKIIDKYKTKSETEIEGHKSTIDNLTNGDVIKALFPNAKFDNAMPFTDGRWETMNLDTKDKTGAIYKPTQLRTCADWWNAPYKAESEE